MFLISWNAWNYMLITLLKPKCISSISRVHNGRIWECQLVSQNWNLKRGKREGTYLTWEPTNIHYFAYQKCHGSEWIFEKRKERANPRIWPSKRRWIVCETQKKCGWFVTKGVVLNCDTCAHISEIRRLLFT